MASRGNQTCVQLHDVAKTGLAHQTSFLVVKGTWYPQHFSLAVTDGANAWKIDATEAFVIQRANDLKVTAAQYVDKAHLHLGHGAKSSLYSLHGAGSNGAQLLCTPRDGRDLNTDSTINLPLVAVPVLDLTFEIVQFLMVAYQDLVEKSERKSRTYERTKANIEQSVEELQSQNSQLQYEKTQLEMKVLSIKDSGLKLGETANLAIVPVPSSSTLKRKLDSTIEDSALKKRSSWKGRPPWAPQPPPEPDAVGNKRESSKLRPWTVPSATGKDVGKKLTENERRSPPEEGLSGCDGEWNAGERSNVKMTTLINNESPHTLPKTLPQVTGKKRGRKPKGTVVQAEDTEARLALVRTFGGPQKDPLTRDMLSEHRIEEQSERAIKLLEPYTRQLANPRARRIGKTPLAPKAAGRKRGTTNEEGTLYPRQPSEDTSTQSSVALPLVLSRERVTDTKPGLTKEFNVINADFYDFDNERSKYVMGLGQYWALYDNQDGMPRFYGRIVNLVLEPFQVDVEWLEPYRPALGFSGLVKSAELSVACGEFKRDTITAQTLAAFSHRVEVEADAKKKMYRIYPRKGEVWALYKDWDKPLTKDQFSEKEVPKFDYELVEILSDYSKERGVKVGPITKVPGFKTVFRSGGSMSSHWISGKDLQALFSHQIATHRFDGTETRIVPRGSFGLDSASTPEQFLSSASRIINTPAPPVEIMQTISESG
ncbi:hypothetical protein KC19_10G157700 [Ceratodon purpureus]|uniref:DUF3444 domain-containing protein n=1 Tax=Ceratodon purpureus TaxID=3225 RepID=A0A8T0GPL4_CERPU|nr:hypothetical protein KC19_10G157700 [Ceratodon purpureus]